MNAFNSLADFKDFKKYCCYIQAVFAITWIIVIMKFGIINRKHKTETLLDTLTISFWSSLNLIQYILTVFQNAMVGQMLRATNIRYTSHHYFKNYYRTWLKRIKNKNFIRKKFNFECISQSHGIWFIDFDDFSKVHQRVDGCMQLIPIVISNLFVNHHFFINHQKSKTRTLLWKVTSKFQS